MSAILLGKKALEDPFQIEEKEEKNKKEDEEKEEIIEGKNKTYVIAKTLGKGTFGKVKLAYNIENKNEKYACKILLKSNIKDEDDKMRCVREMDILKKMHHVNVVRTYEIISTDKIYYIFMDFCSKGELFNYIVKKQHLSEEQSAFFYYQLINGIEYIHKKGVCHRDLKPENLLLTEKNKLKIIDFGLSNYFRGSLLETPCGSPCYASPEMVMGNKYDGFRIDIWSSGIILYAMLCGYLPFEEMENDEYNEVLFRNIVECNVEYPSEFITPVAKDLLSRILVKDPRKRITIEEIKNHNFYLFGELLYKQTFESMGNFNEYVFLVDNDKYIDELKNSDKKEENSLNKKYMELQEEILKNYEKEINLIENNYKNETENNNNKDNGTDKKQTKTEKEKEREKVIENINKEIINISPKKGENKSEKIFDIKQILTENNDEKIDIKKEIKEKKAKSKNSHKKEEFYELNYEEKPQKKQLSLEIYNNIKLPIDNIKKEKTNKNNKSENSLNVKIFKTNKGGKSKKEYSIQDEFNKKSNVNLNSKEINFKNQYLKTEINPSNSKQKTKKGYYQCKLLNKKLVNNSKITFDNIIKSLQNKNNLKSKTPKRFLTKKILQKNNNVNSNTQSNSLIRKKYFSYSPGIRNVTKNGKISNNIEKNLNFPKQNYIPLTTYGNNKNSYNALSDNILKYFNTKNFLNNNKEFLNKNLKPSKQFMPKKNEKNIGTHNINIFKNENYFRTNMISKNNNEDRKSIRKSTNNTLNMKSVEYCLSSNCSKKVHSLADKNGDKINKNNNAIYENNNAISKNTKKYISKKSFNNLKEANYMNNIFNDNLKAAPYSTSHTRGNTETIKNKKNMSLNNKSNSKSKINKNLKSKSKKNTYNLLSSKANNHNKDNIDNNIIINFNILKPNIFFDQQRATLRKTRMNKIALNTNGVQNSNNMMSTKVERPMTESNFCSTVRNTFFNRSNKYKNNNYKNIDTKQIKKSKEIKQIIKSIHDMNKNNQGNNNNNNIKKRLNTEC